MRLHRPYAFCLLLTLGVAASLSPAGRALANPTITKLGTVGLDLVETTPIVFNDTLYRLQWENRLNDSSQWRFDFVNVATGEKTAPFAQGWMFASAYTENGKVYVTGTQAANVVKMWSSADLTNWTESTALSLGSTYTIYNTSICKAGDKYVMSYEIGKPANEAGTAFTARFATSSDLKTWTVTPTNCVYAKDRYTAPHALRYCDGYYYLFYLESFKNKPSGDFQTFVVRSKDLISWESSTCNPVLVHSADDKLLYPEGGATFTDEQKATIAAAVNINNSDIDFCEYNGRLVIYYSWGNQTGKEFLARAVYDGTEAQFLHACFGEEVPEPSTCSLIGAGLCGLAAYALACVWRKRIKANHME
jgi:hypothetical protein